MVDEAMNKCRDGRRTSGGDSFCSWLPGPYAHNTNSTQSYLCLAHFQQHRERSQSVVRRESFWVEIFLFLQGLLVLIQLETSKITHDVWNSRCSHSVYLRGLTLFVVPWQFLLFFSFTYCHVISQTE